MASKIGIRTPDLANVVTVAPVRSVAPVGVMEPEAWTESWRRNEFSYLRDRLEAVERELRRRTILLGAALALSLGLAAGLATITFVDAPWTEWARNNLAGSAGQLVPHPPGLRLKGEVSPDAG